VNKVTMGILRCFFVISVLAGATLLTQTAGGQLVTDPGVRGGAPSAGGFLSGLSTDELNFATAALGNLGTRASGFNGSYSVTGTGTLEPLPGLGPRFSSNGCWSCHNYPAVGGASPPLNLEVGIATEMGGRNTVPSAVYFVDGLPLIRSNGPTRIAWQPSVNGLLKLYTITGRSDAVGCTLSQPDFATLLAKHDIAPTIPIPLYGIGLVEDTPQTNMISAEDAAYMTGLGITPLRFNYDRDGGATRLGWKSDASSVEAFAARAFWVDVGVTTQIYPRKNDETSGCVFNATPEDHPLLARRSPNTSSISADYASQQVLASQFARYLAPPTPACVGENGGTSTCYTGAQGAVTTGSVYNGEQMFNRAGCNACHIKTHTTGLSPMTGQSNVSYDSLSDYGLHNMGSALANGIHLGAAGSADYKTAALWGLGQRLWLIHDGRTSDLYQAIQAHYSTGSEANTVILNFLGMSASNQQDVLNFLRAQ